MKFFAKAVFILLMFMCSSIFANTEYRSFDWKKALCEPTEEEKFKQIIINIEEKIKKEPDNFMHDEVKPLLKECSDVLLKKKTDQKDLVFLGAK